MPFPFLKCCIMHINILKRNGSRAGGLVNFTDAGSPKASFLPLHRLLCSRLGKSCTMANELKQLSWKFCSNTSREKTHFPDSPIALDFVSAFPSSCWWVYHTSSPGKDKRVSPQNQHRLCVIHTAIGSLLRKYCSLLCLVLCAYDSF